MGDDEAAEEAYRCGIAAGEAYCHHNLAVLLAERGDFDGAVEQFRLGAAAGDQLAADALRELEDGRACREIFTLVAIRRWWPRRSEEPTSELQSRQYLVCRLLLSKKKNILI